MKKDKCKCVGVPNFLLEVADGTICPICFKFLTLVDIKKRIALRSAERKRGKKKGE